MQSSTGLPPQCANLLATFRKQHSLGDDIARVEGDKNSGQLVEIHQGRDAQVIVDTIYQPDGIDRLAWSSTATAATPPPATWGPARGRAAPSRSAANTGT